MAQVYVAFYKYKKPIKGWRSLIERLTDTVIRTATRGKYSHCEIAVKRPSGLYDCYSSSPRDGGVRKKVMDLPPARWDLVPVDVSSSQVWRVFKRTVGSRYDYLGVIGFMLRKQQSSRFYCSEFCATVLGRIDTHQSPQSLYDDLM